MFDFDYPKVKHSLARTAPARSLSRLIYRYPGSYSWRESHGFLDIGMCLNPLEPIHPLLYLEEVFLAFFRIAFSAFPSNKNSEFYSKKSSMVKRMKANANVESLIYDQFHCCNEDRSAT